MPINVHSIIPCSTVNGPGKRLVVFFQGCARACPGCFNPATHSLKTVTLYEPEEVFGYLERGVQGITISGGEPFLQPQGLFNILKIAKENYSLSTVVYTGFAKEELEEKKECKEVFRFIDVLIDGHYDEWKKEDTLLARGSMNQTLYFFSDIYSIEDFYMPGKIELIIGGDGLIRGTGFGGIKELLV